MQGRIGCELSTGAVPYFSSKSSKIGGPAASGQCTVPVSLQLLDIGHFSPIGCPLILMGTEKWDLGIHGNFRDSSATKHPFSSLISLHTPTSLLVSSHCKIVMMTQEYPLSFSGCYCAMLILGEIKTSGSI